VIADELKNLLNSGHWGGSCDYAYSNITAEVFIMYFV